MMFQGLSFRSNCCCFGVQVLDQTVDDSNLLVLDQIVDDSNLLVLDQTVDDSNLLVFDQIVNVAK
jgi:hypothetical protein